jgi:hypothetical protein
MRKAMAAFESGCNSSASPIPSAKDESGRLRRRVFCHLKGLVLLEVMELSER